MAQVFDENGNEVRLGTELGRGGEGAVFAIPGTNTVVKLYLNPVPQLKAEKLGAMARAGSPELRGFAAWPTEVLRDRRGTIIGFTMPLVPLESKEIHRLYSPKSRRADFPSASFRFLIRAGANIARAFASVHANGHVIGDVNHGNVLVANDATVTLIDCDSYQIHSNGKRYLCEVGVPTYTPPELQNGTFAGIVRTQNHDCFGLAVLLFHLLFMGRHPFAGRYMNKGDMQIEQAIEDFRFAFSARQQQTRMLPPPHTVSLQELGTSIGSLFEQAFSPSGVQGGRPSAAIWATSLAALEKTTRQCSSNRGHYYPSHLNSCLWCRIESATAVSLFGIGVVVGVAGFDLERVWRAIATVQFPITKSAVPHPRQFVAQIQQSVKTAPVRRKRITYILGGIAALLLSIVLVFMVNPPPLLALGMLGGGIYACAKSRRKSHALAADLTSHVATATSQYDSLVKKWQQETDAGRFKRVRAELESARSAYTALVNERLQRLQQLERDKYNRQLKRFLESHRLEDTSISGIGAGRKQLLASYGIEDAFDLTESAIAAVPGFGPGLTARLMVWRQTVEQGFTFNAREPSDPRDVKTIEQAIASKRASLERVLSSGAAQLQSVAQNITFTNKTMMPQIEAAAMTVAQTQADLRLW